MGMFSELMRPAFSILDPETTYSLPARQVGNGVVDAMVHILEQYMTYPVNGKVQDYYAESLLKILMEDGPQALTDPVNYDVRANIMWAATQALNGTLSLGMPGDWSIHAIGHQITALYGLDHAQTLAIVLPAVWSYKKAQKKAKLLQYADHVLGIKEANDDQCATLAIEKTRSFFESMGMSTRFSAYGLNATAIPAIVEKLKQHGRLKLGEHGDITPDDVAQLLQLAL
jgi:NADP-dependent alcohol dehydrogenase